MRLQNKALRLVLYEKELDTKEVYRLIVLSVYLNTSFKECSKSLSKLEHLSMINEAQRETYKKQSIAIFTKLRNNRLVGVGRTMNTLIRNAKRR